MTDDIRQSDEFASFMKKIGWTAKKLEETYVYLKKIWPLGYFAKLPRPKKLINLNKLKKFKKNNKIFTFKISPFINIKNTQYTYYKKKLLENNFKIDISPFNPTTTRYIHLNRSEKEIFNSFTSAKRRAVRRARKNNISVKKSIKINDFINLRKKQYFPLGFLIGREMKALWKCFYPKKAMLLLAYYGKKTLHKPLAGIFLIYHSDISYYWFASSSKKGKRLYAPTLLVWEAIKFSKRKGCKIFDFEGIYDKRFPKISSSWKGFTRFKKGFGGNQITFSENFYLSNYLNFI